MMSMLKGLWHDEDGATMVEYALAVALIAVVAIAAFLLVGQATQTKMTDVSNEISAAR
jgi:pilus assembly protein Flp/PilA